MIFLAGGTMVKILGNSLGLMEFTVCWKGPYRTIIGIDIKLQLWIVATKRSILCQEIYNGLYLAR